MTGGSSIYLEHIDACCHLNRAKLSFCLQSAPKSTLPNLFVVYYNYTTDIIHKKSSYKYTLKFSLIYAAFTSKFISPLHFLSQTRPWSPRRVISVVLRSLSSRCGLQPSLLCLSYLRSRASAGPWAC